MIHEHKELSIPLPGQGFINFRFNLKEKDEVMVSVEDTDNDMQSISLNELRDFIDNLNTVTKQLESHWVSLSAKKPPAIINDYRSA